MNPVMTGCDQDIFQPAHFADELGVDEDTPDLCRRIHKNDIQRSEAQEGQGDKIDETIERLKDRRPETYREIEMFGRVMGDVYRPEKADLVVPAVQPVVEEILCQQQHEPVRKDIGDREPVMPVTDIEDHEIDPAEQQIDAAVQEHQINIGKRIFPGIGLALIVIVVTMSVVAEQDFESDYDKVQRCADEEQYLFSEVFHGVKNKSNNAPLQRSIAVGSVN